jgi:hypothetical protein
MVEARPDVLEYAAQALAADGHPIRVRWLPIAEAPRFPAIGDYLALRTDTDKESRELRLFQAAGLERRAERVYSGVLHEFTFDVYRVTAP